MVFRIECILRVTDARFAIFAVLTKSWLAELGEPLLPQERDLGPGRGRSGGTDPDGPRDGLPVIPILLPFDEQDAVGVLS